LAMEATNSPPGLSHAATLRSRAEQPRPGVGAQLPAARRKARVVAGERLARVLDGEALGRQPKCRLAPRQPFLAAHPPVHEARVAQGVEHPHEARREEGAPQFLLAVAHPRGEAQDLRRRVPPVDALPVGEVARCSPRRTARGPGSARATLLPSRSPSRPCGVAR
jgi:hypothetical protein